MGTPLNFSDSILMTSKFLFTKSTNFRRSPYFDHSAIPGFDNFIHSRCGDTKWLILVPVQGENFCNASWDGECSLNGRLSGSGSTSRGSRK